MMKNIIRVCSLTFVLMVMSCDKTSLDLQVDPNQASPEQASMRDLFNNIQLTFRNVFLGLQGTPGGMTRMYFAGQNFQYVAALSPNTFRGLWFNVYSNLFPDIDALVMLAEERNQGGMAGALKIMKAYALMGLVDLFGNVPLSEAGQGTDVISPKADPGAEVYQAAVALLTEAINQLDGAPPVGGDLYYGGNVARWRTLARTLQLRAALNTRVVNASGAASTINSILATGDVIDEVAEDFQFRYGSQRTNPNSRHPDYNDMYEVTDGTYMNNYYMWLLRAEKVDENDITIVDPRLRYYFYRKIAKSEGLIATAFSCHYSQFPDPAFSPPHYLAVDPRLPYCEASPDGYLGRDHLNGEGIPADGQVTFRDTRMQGTTGGLGAGIAPIVLSSYVDFMRAEAALTLGTSDDARAMLESGIRKSIAKVMSFASLVPSTMARSVTTRDGTSTVQELYVPKDADIDRYVNFVLSSYDAASMDDKLDIITKEYYIALFGNGYDAYNLYRRTGKPGNIQPGIEPDTGPFPRSFFLPDVHVDRNANATQKALTDRVFWDDGSTNLR